MGNKQRISITILGSGTCVPSLQRHPCSALVRGKSIHILLDAGPGTMGQLLKLGVQINDIDMILLSHFHLDHCAEIAPFLFATKYPGFKRQKKLVLVGGTGIKALFEKLNNAYDNTLEMPEDYFHIIELDEKGSLNLNLEGIQLDYNSVNHRTESRAYRLTDETGFSVVYSGDTDYSNHLIDLSRESDILICESAFPDGQKVSGHLTPSLAGEIASKANVKKLVLTHFYPECDSVDIKAQCQKTFTGSVILAKDLLNL
ncbi:MAG: MBL fold metallo-hydrolase [Desulfobacterales bacterium]|nr:MBL fold metallo-hydrolase [Desulfobacterales bacterium]